MSEPITVNLAGEPAAILLADVTLDDDAQACADQAVVDGVDEELEQQQSERWDGLS